MSTMSIDTLIAHVTRICQKNGVAHLLVIGSFATGTARKDISWKVMKDILVKVMEIMDFALGSPRQVLQAAYNNDLISDDEWLIMLKTRNQLAHDYDGEFAVEVYQNIIDSYIPLLEKFRVTAEQYYKDDCAEKDSFQKE